MMREAIILAGGLGTRLREAVPDLPKCMAPVAGRPFLSYVIDELRIQGVQKFIFSLGYKWGVIEEYLQKNYPTLEYTSVIEEEPLGTGGAIALALKKAKGPDIVVTNGDTLFKVSIPRLFHFHENAGGACTLALKKMENFDRYGVVTTDSSNRIISFQEKKFYAEGFINGGVYILNKEAFSKHNFPERFSFEKDYLETFTSEGNFYGSPQDGYFIDIGIPEDYQRAQQDLRRPALDLQRINKNWTLFLDRDGVINEERVGTYVLNWGQFIFSKGVLDTFKALTERFGHVFIVSNQRGVGKQLMTEEDLQSIHYEMKREVEIVGGHIDQIYYCTDKDDKSFYRKPNPGMAFQASQEFAGVDFNKSIMVGNKPSDMRFGRSAGMFTVFLTTTNPDQPYPHTDIDLIFPDLYSFAKSLGS